MSGAVKERGDLNSIGVLYYRMCVAGVICLQLYWVYYLGLVKRIYERKCFILLMGRGCGNLLFCSSSFPLSCVRSNHRLEDWEICKCLAFLFSSFII